MGCYLAVGANLFARKNPWRINSPLPVFAKALPEKGIVHALRAQLPNSAYRKRIDATLSHQLSWPHFVLLLPLGKPMQHDAFPIARPAPAIVQRPAAQFPLTLPDVQMVKQLVSPLPNPTVGANLFARRMRCFQRRMNSPLPVNRETVELAAKIQENFEELEA